MDSQTSSLHVARRPRVELRPQATDTDGDVAIKLAALAGIPLEDWQAEDLRIMLSRRPDGRWAAREFAGLVGRQQGKTTGLGIPRALAGLLLFGERLIMWSAHEYKTAIESFLQARQALLTLGEEAGQNLIALDDGAVMVKVNNTNGEEGFELSTGQRWRFIARSKGSGRGFSGDVNIIDEAFAYTRLQQSALAPTMLARPNPQTIYLSSPPLDGKTGEVLYALRTRAEEGGNEKLAYLDYGLAVSLDDVERMAPDQRKAFLDDRSNWSAALPARRLGPQQTEEAIQQLRDEMDSLDFAREVLGCWPVQLGVDGAWQVISEKAWRARGGLEATDRPKPRVVFAIAAAYPDAELGSIAVCGRRGEELLGQVVAHRPGTSWIPERIVELRDKHRPSAILLDRKGPARHLIPELVKLGVDLTFPTADDMAQSAAAFYAAVCGDAPSFRHYDQPELTGAVSTSQKHLVGDGWRYARRGVADISPLEAVSLAMWGASKRKAPPPAPVAVAGEVSGRSVTGDLMSASF